MAGDEIERTELRSDIAAAQDKRAKRERREQIAAAILPAIVGALLRDSRGITNSEAPRVPEKCAESAVVFADALIAELDK